jgi:hypothetical protein
VIVALVIVTGAPGAGKTTLAGLLGRQLMLPMLAKDDVKVALHRALGATAPEQSLCLSMAAFEVLFTLSRRLLEARTGHLLEGNFICGHAEPNLSPLMELAPMVQLHCATTRDETLRRFANRSRHEAHFDLEAYPRLVAALESGRHDPLRLPVPTLVVDTSAGYRPDLEAIKAFVSEHGRGS